MKNKHEKMAEVKVTLQEIEIMLQQNIDAGDVESDWMEGMSSMDIVGEALESLRECS